MAIKDSRKSVEALTHDEARRRHIPTAEYQSVMRKEDEQPLRVAYGREAAGLETEKADRNRDLDPQLVWRGKDEQDWSDLVVHAPPLYIQEKIKPKVLIDDLLRQSEKTDAQKAGFQPDIFADFNGIPTEAAKTEFYQHDANWTNRMILGDSLQVMASLAEREGLRGRVQCIYLDPPYGIEDPKGKYGEAKDFAQMILENLKTAGVQQAHKEDKITFTSLVPWPGEMICAEGRYIVGNAESGSEKRAAIFIGPEFGTVSRPDLVAAAREAGDADFDVLITCAFNYDAHSSEFDKLGRIPVLKARMNADLHMADDLKNTGKGNLFVIFGEPDIDILDDENGQVRVKVNGVDVFHPNTGEVRSDGAEGIACWFIDTDYNEESFFVRHAYFLGANDPYKSLKTTLKAEINEEAWATLHSDTSRPFDKPASGRIAVKVINHLGDEVMKVFRV